MLSIYQRLVYGAPGRASIKSPFSSLTAYVGYHTDAGFADIYSKL
jgi:hypothetical protein